MCVTVPLHGPSVTPDIVMDYLEKYMKESSCTIFHLDIAPNVSYILTNELFEAYVTVVCYTSIDPNRGGYDPV